jgi:peptidoglycan hydrolase CwlO-like protein
MAEQSSRFPRRATTVAAVFGIAVFGVGAGAAVSGCGGDDNSNDASNAINSVQGGLSTAQGAISTAEQKAKSISTQVQSVQSQVQSVQSQVQQNQNGGSKPGY